MFKIRGSTGISKIEFSNLPGTERVRVLKGLGNERLVLKLSLNVINCHKKRIFYFNLFQAMFQLTKK